MRCSCIGLSETVNYMEQSHENSTPDHYLYCLHNETLVWMTMKSLFLRRSMLAQ